MSEANAKPKSKRQPKNRIEPIETNRPEEVEKQITEKAKDMSRFLMTQEYLDALDTTEQVTIPVQKPDREWFIRTHPDPDYWQVAGVLEIQKLKDVAGFWLVDPSVAAEAQHHAGYRPRLLVTSVNQFGETFLWPMLVSGAHGRELDSWNRSARLIAEAAKDKWVKVVSKNGMYDKQVAQDDQGEPKFVDRPFDEILNMAFGDRIIDTVDHAALLALMGAKQKAID